MNSMNQKGKEKIIQAWFYRNGYSKIKRWFTSYCHSDPVSQAEPEPAGAFQHLFFESEVSRLHQKKLSFREYNCLLGILWGRQNMTLKKEETSALNKQICPEYGRSYGIVPAEATPDDAGQSFDDHKTMAQQMKSYLEMWKATYAWECKMKRLRLLNQLWTLMGEPPLNFYFEGSKYSLKEFLINI